jgi:hypothetical protein
MATPFASRVFAGRVFGFARWTDLSALTGGVSGVATALAGSRPFAPRPFAARAFASRAFGGALGAASAPIPFTDVFLSSLSGPTYLATRITDMPIYLDNAYAVRQRVSSLDPGTGRIVGVTGLSLVAFLTDDVASDTPLDPTLSSPMSEGADGLYSAVFHPTVFTALDPFVDATVFEVVTDGETFRVATPVLVLASRSGA